MNRKYWATLVFGSVLLAGCGGSDPVPSDDPTAAGVESLRDDGSAAGVDSPAGNPKGSPGLKPPEATTLHSVDPAGNGSGTSPPATPPALRPEGSAGASGDDSLRSLLIDLTNDHLVVRRRASTALEQIPDAAKRCIEMLQSGPAEVRRGAAFFLLGKFAAGQAAIDDALIAALTDEDAGVRHIALQAVNELEGDDVLPAINQLARMLENPQEDKHIRTQVVRRLARLGPKAQPVLTTIQKLGRGDADRNVRAACLYAVYRIAEPEAGIEVFGEVLRAETDPGLRGAAASRLGSYGAARAESTVPELEAALDRDKDASVRGKVADALARIGPPALPALVKRFKVADREVRILAIFAVGKMGPAAAQAAPQLQSLLDDEDRDIRLAAQLSLRRLYGAP